jgi:transcriptional regulator with XRE-family HTH domain
MDRLSLHLRHAREAKRLSQEQLARRLAPLSVTAQHLSAVERDVANLRLDAVVACARVLGVDAQPMLEAAIRRQGQLILDVPAGRADAAAAFAAAWFKESVR